VVLVDLVFHHRLQAHQLVAVAVVVVMVIALVLAQVVLAMAVAVMVLEVHLAQVHLAQSTEEVAVVAVQQSHRIRLVAQVVQELLLLDTQQHKEK
jgi:hypothetical protein